MKKGTANRSLAVAIMVAATLLAGCSSESDSLLSADEPVTVTMSLPDSLSGSATTAVARQLAGVASTIEQCSDYYDNDAAQNWTDNGYDMTSWVIGLSQAESCFVDVLVHAVISNAATLANTGVQLISDASTPTGSPTHLRYDRDGDGRRLWIYFATPGQNLPADLTGVKVIYITWTRSGVGNATGRFILANDSNAQGTTSNVRIDFSRAEGVASNRIYIDMGADQPDGIAGFRIDITAEGIGSSTSYRANGLMAMTRQPLPNLPATESFAIPSFDFQAVADAGGDGVAQASFNDFAIHLAQDADNDGVYNESQDFMFGSYQFSLLDHAYFPATATSKADIEWRRKDVTGAVYVNSSGTNNRDAVDLPGMYSFLENVSATDDVISGYFTTTCTDSDGADCTAFIQLLYDNGVLNSGVQNSTVPEPADWRAAAIAAITPLTTIHPDGEDGTTTFTVPSPF